MKKYVGITACPTGIAHTYMAAEKLEETAKETGNQIKVETQGSIGVENELTADDIREADAVVVAADTEVDLSRFAQYHHRGGSHRLGHRIDAENRVGARRLLRIEIHQTAGC